ncbi:TetR family transcriptional regulator C-terminal domain-containing protein [Streptomyces sp. NA02950]|uniref:TetR/AcrR family transcriptional regulator n=1 Tax=Streptomyces sp. NA02950 TaxID=2742137 RepID=UPI001591EF44|nr:TetR family transcriptional regulator C-terminal domain-containing protein [Streptomyces sp. NA02950]QKV94895.1 TetR family transcriptional regulator C-terminal domain-containing protein [Streptomyces sp. NA02950]
MPRRVDHEERRKLIAEALWRIAAARGLEGASLRDVAAEAGISLGQLQHYFTRKDEMLGFALEHIGQLAERRIRARIEALPGEPTPRTVLRETLAEILPLDENSRIGNLVQIAYFVRALHDEAPRAHAREGARALRAFFAGQVERGVERGEVAAGLDPEREASLLMALVEGVTGHTLLELHTPEEAMGLIDLHLERLFGASA